MQNLAYKDPSVLLGHVVERARAGGLRPQRAARPTLEHFIYCSDYDVFIDGIWFALAGLARERAYFFGKHGERFDRRLYAELEAITRVSLALRRYGV